MKVKLSEVVEAMAAMSVLADKDIPAKVAYRISKLVRKMNSATNDFNKARNAAILKYGVKITLTGKDGKPEEVTQVQRDKVEAFNAEVQALLDEEVELEGCAKIALADIAEVSIKGAVLAALHAFIEAPPEQAKE